MSEQRLIDANALPMYKVKIVHSFGIVEGSVVFPDDIKKAPTIDAVPVVHARWREPWPYHTGVICGKCETHAARKHHYCPSCGAKMDGGRDEKD